MTARIPELERHIVFAQDAVSDAYFHAGDVAHDLDKVRAGLMRAASHIDAAVETLDRVQKRVRAAR